MNLKDIITEKGKELADAAKNIALEKGKEILAEAKQKIAAEAEGVKKTAAEKISAAVEERKGKLTEKVTEVPRLRPAGPGTARLPAAGLPGQLLKAARRHTMRFSLRVLGVSVFAPGVLLAQSPAPTPPPPPPIWSGEASASFVQTTGNSQSRSLGAGLKLLYQSAPWKAELKSAFIESSANDVETSRRFNAALRGERALRERLAVYAQGSYLRDLFAGIRGQEIAEAGGIYKFLTGPRHSLSASAGFAYTKEQRLAPAPDLSFGGASAGLAYGWKISPSAEFTEEFNYLYDFKDSSDWRVNNVASLTASVTKLLALKLSHQLSYLRSPVPGKKRTDTTVLASLIAKF